MSNNSVKSEEKLTRFTFQSGHCNPATGKIHHNAFEPRTSEKSSAKEVSVFVTTVSTDTEVTDIGKNHVAKIQKREPKARIDFFCDVVESQDLKVETETSTHPLHANILGWPSTESEELAKMQAVAIAIKNDSRTKIFGL